MRCQKIIEYQRNKMARRNFQIQIVGLFQCVLRVQQVHQNKLKCNLKAYLFLQIVFNSHNKGGVIQNKIKLQSYINQKGGVRGNSYHQQKTIQYNLTSYYRPKQNQLLAKLFIPIQIILNTPSDYYLLHQTFYSNLAKQSGGFIQHKIFLTKLMRKYSVADSETTTLDNRLLTEVQSKQRQLLDNRKTLYDGIDFKPSMNIGISSNVFQLSDEEEICYISGNQYCLASSIDAQNMTMQFLPCNSIQGKTIMIQTVKNKKISMVASLQVQVTQTNQINKINYFSRRDQAHRDIIITAKGKALSFNILSDGKSGFFVLDQSTQIVNKFITYFFNVERESVITKLDKPHKAIKIISSTMGDYNLILCPTVIYEVQAGLAQDAQLVQFQVRQYLDEGETYIQGGFVKSSFNLVLLTNDYNVLLFDHHKLLSKHSIHIWGVQRPLITNFQAGISQIVLELDHKKLAIFNLRNKIFQFGCYATFFQEAQNDYKILDFKTVRREIYVLFQKKNVEMWRISIRSKGQENLKLLAQNISVLNYESPPSVDIVVSPIALREMITLHSDGSLRVWDLQKGYKGSKSFFQHVYCMSIHPIGHELFVGFKEYGRVYMLAGFQLETKCTFKIRGISASKYSKDGQHLLLLQSNVIYQLNAYSYETIRSIFINMNNITKIDIERGMFLASNDNYLALYSLQGAKMMEKRTSCYSISSEWIIYAEATTIHVFKSVSDNIQQVQNFECVLEAGQKITVIQLVELLGVLLLGTSKGNILQFMWPITQKQKDACFKYQAASSSIIYMVIQQNNEQIALFTEDSIVVVLQFVQIIQGQKTTSMYSISKNEFYESGNRRSIINREYMFKGFELQSSTLQKEKNKQVLQLEFYAENFTNQVEQTRMKLKQNIQDNLQYEKATGDNQVNGIQSEISRLRQEWEGKIQNISKQIEQNKKTFQKEKQQKIEDYQQKLLQIIKKDKVLRKRKETQIVRLSQIIIQLGEKQKIIGARLFQQKQIKYADLYSKLIGISKDLQDDREKTSLIVQQVQNQQKAHLASIMGELNRKLEVQENTNRALNISISKLKQEISMFNLRSKQLQNVTDQMQKQIKQLQEIREQYQSKKVEMEEELQSKQIIINMKQQELKKIFSQNRNKKNLKDIHEYLMAQYQKQIDPGEMRRNQLLGKVKMMNQELIHETQWKVQIKNQLKEAESKIKQLKDQKQQNYYDNMDLNNKLSNLSHKIKSTMSKSPEQWMPEFNQLWQNLKPNSHEQTKLEAEQKQMFSHKLINKAIMNKQQIHRKIIESEKASVWQEKHKQGMYKKIQNENIELVKQHNLLEIERKHLQQHVQLLKASIQMIQQNDGTTLRRKSASLAVITHRPMAKLTPFQQYTAEQQQIKRRFSTMDKPASTTRLKPISNSSAWMKSVIEDISKGRAEGMQIVKKKISSFANPEKSKVRKIISLHSNDSNQKQEEMIKIFNKVTIDTTRQRVGSGRVRIISGRKS